jgi:anti-sigma regulatory factor (Ser/Thr protein kinase)
MDSRVRALYKIDARPEAAAQARRIIAEELSSRLSARVVTEIQLMVSELVTNGVVHGAREVNAPVMLDLCVNGDVRCRVSDQGAGFAARPSRSQPVQLGGWGLRVVEELSDRWGMQRSPQRTEVWFERQCA